MIAEDVAGVDEARGHAVRDGDVRGVAHAAETSERRHDVGLGVERLLVRGLDPGTLRAQLGLRIARRRVLPPGAPLRPFRELCLQLRRVEEDEARELHGPGGRVDRAREAVRDQRGDEAAVIEVRVREEERIDLARREREGQPVPRDLVRAALEHAAVDEDARAIGREEELRAGDGGRAAEERELQCATSHQPCPYSGRPCSGPCSGASS